MTPARAAAWRAGVRMELLDNPWIKWLLALAIAVVVAFFGHLIVYAILRRTVARESMLIASAAVRRSFGPTRLILLTLALMAVLPSLPNGDDVQHVVQRLATLLMTGALGWLAIALTGVVEDYVHAKFDITAADNLVARQMYTRTRVLRRVAVAVIGVITLCLMLMSFPSVRQIGVSIFASAGIAGLVIGMAARPALSNLIAGVQLALTDPMRIDDVVIVEGEWGWIEEITSTYVVVRIWDLRRLVVPLSYFIENPFQNWTRRNADILGTVFLHADYRVPVDDVRQKLFEILDGTDLWDGKVRNLQVTETNERGVQLRALMSASSAGRAWDLRCYVREALLTWFQDAHPASLPRMRVELDPPALTEAGGGGPSREPGPQLSPELSLDGRR